MIPMKIIDIEDGNDKDWFDSLLNNTSDVKINAPFKLYSVFKYVKLGKDKEAVKLNKKWDMVNLNKSMQAAKEILKYYDGDLKKAAIAVLEIGDYMENKLRGPWSLWAVQKNLTEWEEGRLAK